MVKCKKGKCVYKGKFCEPKYLNKKQCECKKSKYPAGGNGGGGGGDGGDDGGGGEEDDEQVNDDDDDDYNDIDSHLSFCCC